MQAWKILRNVRRKAKRRGNGMMVNRSDFCQPLTGIQGFRVKSHPIVVMRDFIQKTQQICQVLHGVIPEWKIPDFRVLFLNQMQGTVDQSYRIAYFMGNLRNRDFLFFNYFFQCFKLVLFGHSFYLPWGFCRP